MAVGVFEAVATEPGRTIAGMLQDVSARLGRRTLVLYWRSPWSGRLFPTMVVPWPDDASMDAFLESAAEADGYDAIRAAPGAGGSAPLATSSIADRDGKSLGRLVVYGEEADEPHERLTSELDGLAARLVPLRNRITAFCAVQLRRSAVAACNAGPTAPVIDIDGVLKRVGRIAEIALGVAATAAISRNPTKRRIRVEVVRRSGGRRLTSELEVDESVVDPSDGRSILRLLDPTGDSLTEALPISSESAPSSSMVFAWSGPKPSANGIDAFARLMARHLTPILTLAQMRRTLRAHRSSLAVARRRFGFSAHASREMSASLDEGTIYETIVNLAAPEACDYCLLHVAKESARFKLVSLAGNDAPTLASLRAHFSEAVPATQAEDGVPLVFRMKDAEITWNVGDQTATLRLPPDHLLALLACGIRSAMSVPLWNGAEPYAVLTFCYTATSIDHTDVELLRNFALRAENALGNARRFSREHRISHLLQRALLPSLPTRIGAMPVSYAYTPAGPDAQVGGDWYDVFPLPRGRFGISVGDVAGHGIDATAVMNVARHAIRVAALSQASPADVLERVNVMLHMEPQPPMLTAVFGVLHPEFRRFEFAVAGHPPPIIARADGSLEMAGTARPPLGVSADMSYETERAQLGLDDALVLYSDGMIEFGRDLIRGEKRFHEAIRAALELADPEPAQAIQERVFNGARPQDDAVVLVVRCDLPRQLAIVLEAIPHTCRTTRVLVRQFLADHKVDGVAAHDFITAVGEAVTNAVEHAYFDSSPGSLRLRLELDDDRITATVADEGKWREGKRGGRGRGVMLMRATMDDVDIDSTAHGTIVRLEKKLALAGEVGAARRG